MTVRREPFGALPGGAETTLYTLTNEAGMSVSLCDYGARIVRLLAPDAAGVYKDIALGFDSVAPYIDADDCLGAVCGRVANRLAGGSFTLSGRAYQITLNDGRNALHGGVQGFHRKLWQTETLADGIRFSYTAADGEEGFPGRLCVSATYRLSTDNVLSIDYDAVSDADTPVNLTNHTYFNLAGHDSGVMHAQTLQISADFYTPADAELLPTGEIVSVAGTPFDFRSAKPIGRDIAADSEQLRHGRGYDHNFVLKQRERGALSPAAVACDPESGRSMEVWTTLPGIQLYTANALAERTGKNGARYGFRHAYCLETQVFPDAMRHTHFPSPMVYEKQHSGSRTEFRFLKNN